MAKKALEVGLLTTVEDEQERAYLEGRSAEQAAEIARLQKALDFSDQIVLAGEVGNEILLEERNILFERVRELTALIREASIVVRLAGVLMPGIEIHEWDERCRSSGVRPSLLSRLEEI